MLGATSIFTMSLKLMFVLLGIPQICTHIATSMAMGANMLEDNR